jgi:hypothetical protein
MTAADFSDDVSVCGLVNARLGNDSVCYTHRARMGPVCDKHDPPAQAENLSTPPQTNISVVDNGVL